MFIIGIDFSKNSPGVMLSELDEDLDIINIQYRGFSSVKKTAKKDEDIIFYHKKQFNDDIEKAIWMKEHILEFIHSHIQINDDIYCAFEGYAFAAHGKVFDIAESTMCTKLGIYDIPIPLRIYDPNSIKKFAIKGNAGKVEMGDAYIKIEDKTKPDLSHLTPYKSPSEDLVDAYFCMRLLQMEMKLRKGILQLRNLDVKTIEIFNRVTKAYPENILVRPFIIKSKE